MPGFRVGIPQGEKGVLDGVTPLSSITLGPDGTPRVPPKFLGVPSVPISAELLGMETHSRNAPGASAGMEIGEGVWDDLPSSGGRDASVGSATSRLHAYTTRPEWWNVQFIPTAGDALVGVYVAYVDADNWLWAGTAAEPGAPPTGVPNNAISVVQRVSGTSTTLATTSVNKVFATGGFGSLRVSAGTFSSGMVVLAHAPTGQSAVLADTGAADAQTLYTTAGAKSGYHIEDCAVYGYAFGVRPS